LYDGENSLLELDSEDGLIGLDSEDGLLGLDSEGEARSEDDKIAIAAKRACRCDQCQGRSDRRAGTLDRLGRSGSVARCDRLR
jgi:hypothetical protein